MEQSLRKFIVQQIYCGVFFFDTVQKTRQV